MLRKRQPRLRVQPKSAPGRKNSRATLRALIGYDRRWHRISIAVFYGATKRLPTRGAFRSSQTVRDRRDLVCSCCRVSEGEIRATVRAGARTFEDVRSRTGAGGACTTCETGVEWIVADERRRAEERRRAAGHPDQLPLF